VKSKHRSRATTSSGQKPSERMRNNKREEGRHGEKREGEQGF
jgi:hypothetical protein